MSQELNNIAPARQMSGRRSKPSMDLLIDNQRILSQYVVPRKNPRLNTLKHHADNISVTDQLEIPNIILKEKPKPKARRRKIIVKSSEENISPKSVTKKRKITSPTVNGLEDDSDIETSKSDFQTDIPRSPYDNLKFKKIETIKTVIPIDVENGTNKEDDDLPLSKVFPDFKPHVTEVTENVEKRPRLVLPPKKKIKFVNINELNGFQTFPKPVSPARPVSVCPVIGNSDSKTTAKSDILSMPKIPKKKKIVLEVVTAVVNDGVTETLEGDTSGPGTTITDGTCADDCGPIINMTMTTTAEATGRTEDTRTDLGTEEAQSLSPPLPPPSALVAPSVLVSPRRCVRRSCTNVAIEDSRWDREYCSPDCAVLHTKSVFGDWLQDQQTQPQMVV